MKKLTVSLAAAIVLAAMTFVGVCAESAETLRLPAGLQAIEEEAFMGDTSVREVVIPSDTASIGPRAFSGCTGLEKVVIENAGEMEIAEDAFEGCVGAVFYAASGSAAAEYAVIHGFEHMEPEESETYAAVEEVLAMVAANRGSVNTVLQDGDRNFSSMRLIVRVTDRLPDISAYHPTAVLRESSDIYFVQFGTAEDAEACYSAIVDEVRFAEPDQPMDAIDEITSRGTATGSTWDTDDPMGFTEYAAFVAENGSSGVTVAVLDSGVERNSMYNSLLRADGASMVANEPNWYDDGPKHGSVVAGIIRDCVGEARVHILPVKVVSNDGTTNTTIIGQGIKYAIQHNASVINMSLNFKESEYVSYWLDMALAKNIKVVAAAGNRGRDMERVGAFPGTKAGVIAVSGLNPDYEISANSNYGSNIGYCAPGEMVTTTAFSGIYNGTSYSAPMVSAALALATMDIYHSVSDLDRTCRNLGSAAYYGKGLMRLELLAGTKVETVTHGTGGPLEILVGQTYALPYAKQPELSRPVSLTAVSSNPGVIEGGSNEAGEPVITAKAPGTAEITLRAENLDGTSVISAVLTVTAITEASAPESIVVRVNHQAVENGKIRLQPEQSVTLEPEVLPASALQEITYELLGSAVAREGNVLTGLSSGTSYLIITSAADAAVRTTVEVEVLTPMESLTVTAASDQIEAGDEMTLTASYSPSGASLHDIEWTSSDENVATVEPTGAAGAVVTGTGYGTATITARVKGAGTGGTDCITEFTVSVRQPYALFFNANGGSCAETSRIAYSGEPIGEELPIPSKEHYTFAGWYTSASGGINVTASSVITCSDVYIIHAHWEQITYTVEYDSNGKNLTHPTAQTKYSGVDLTLTTEQVSASYVVTFNGNGNGTIFDRTITTILDHWNTKADGSGTNYALGDSYTADADITLYAQYTGDTVGNLTSPKRTGFTFQGWYTAATGGTKIKSTTVVTADVMYYAHWRYTVTYDANGGTDAPPAQTLTEGVTMTLSSEMPTRSYTVTFNADGTTTTRTVFAMFNNWNTIADGSGDSYMSGDSYTEGVSATLYAQWTNATVGTLPTPTRSDYTFQGWYTAATGGIEITSGTVVSEDVTYYAQWTYNKESFFDYDELPDGTISITGYSGTDNLENLSIPSTIDGKMVSEIGNNAFKNCNYLTGSLTIPESVTKIGDSAFALCSGLTGSLTIPESVTKIGDSAFALCSGLTGSLTIPDSVTSLGDAAFYGCSGFTGTLTISDNLTSTGARTFYGCNGFTGSLEIPDNLINIGDYAFYNCSGFNGSLSMSDSVTSIGGNAFAGCSGLTGSLTLPSNITKISYAAFVDCRGFTGNLVIPDSVSIIEFSAFSGCSGFTGDLIIPTGVTQIGSYAFYGCSGFTGCLMIPDSVTAIGNGAFDQCSGFTGSLVIPDSVTRIENWTFQGCSGFTGSLVIPDGVTNIAKGAFNNCRRLTGILTIPNSVTSIEEEAFRGCKGFTGSLTIPDSVTEIGTRAFMNCTGITEITIPESVVTLGNDIFLGCDSLTVRCYEGSTAAQSLMGVENITLVIIPASVPMPASYFNYSERSDGTIQIDQYIGPADAVNVCIPKYIDGKAVTVIGVQAFINLAI